MGNRVPKLIEHPIPIQLKKKQGTRTNSDLSTYSTGTRHVVEPPVIIGSFNVQRFGHSKMSDLQVVDVLTKIVCRYDVLVVLEIVDSSGVALKDLLHKVNERWLRIRETAETAHSGFYKVVTSPRVGKTKSKEQYAVFYRENRFQAKAAFVYDDEDGTFFRAPFVAHFSTNCFANSETPDYGDSHDFALIAVHSQPKNAADEIDHLDDVTKWTIGKLKTTNILIMGDLNASAPYVHANDWTTNRLRTDSNYKWLIPDHMCTTVHHALAAYDRIIVYGNQLFKLVVPQSGRVFRYNELEEYKPIEQELVYRISDHYPVEVQFQSRIHPVLQESVKIFEQVIILEDYRKVNPIKFSAKKSNLYFSPFELTVFYNSNQKVSMAELTKKFENVSDAVFGLKKLRQNSILPYSLFALATAQVTAFLKGQKLELIL